MVLDNTALYSETTICPVRPLDAAALESGFFDLLQDVARRTSGYADAVTQNLGVTHAQLLILARIEQRPSLSQRELAADAAVTPATIGRLILRLEARGLVERRPDAKDRRIWRLRLTPAAVPILWQMKLLGPKLYRRLADGIDPRVVELMARGLNRMKENVSARGDGAEGPAPSRRPSGTTRRNLLLAGLALAAALRGFDAVAGVNPAATLRSFYDALLAVMQGGHELGFAGRQQKLAPAIGEAFDLPLMTRLVVGLQWPSLSPEDQRQLVVAFTDFTVASYASEFDDYAGQRFEVDPGTAPALGGDVIVKTKIVRSSGAPVALAYLLRQDAGDWRIVDVFLSGTISQLAARRSEFTAVLRKQGAPGLIASLKGRTKSLATGDA